MRLFSFILLSLLSLSFFGQTNSHKIDSLRAKLHEDSLKIYHFQKFRPIVGIDNRNSFIRKNPVNLNGFQLGVIYKEEHCFGIGFYKVSAYSKIKSATKVVDKDITIIQTLNMSYLTFYYQPALIDKKRFELDLPIELGFGKFVLNRSDSASGMALKPVSAGIVPIGVGLMAIYKPCKWVGISYLFGYRYAKEKNVNFSGAYYSFGLWFDIRQIIRDGIFYLNKKPKYKKEVKKLTV